MGSTKGAIAQASRDQRFVGGHPLAGAETAGVAHAREDLFDGATWYLTPDTDTPVRRSYERLRELIERLGAQPTAIEPDAHDRLMACVSHLPHVLANVLVAQAAAAFEREGSQPRGGTGPSFRHATRVAGANTEVWRDIYLANREALAEALEQAVERCEEFVRDARRGRRRRAGGLERAGSASDRTLLGGDELQLRTRPGGRRSRALRTRYAGAPSLRPLELGANPRIGAARPPRRGGSVGCTAP